MLKDIVLFITFYTSVIDPYLCHSYSVLGVCGATKIQQLLKLQNRAARIISQRQTGSRSFWSLAKVVSQNFCHSSFPPLKNNSCCELCRTFAIRKAINRGRLTCIDVMIKAFDS